MRIGLRLPACDRADRVAAAAAHAEAAGFDSVWVPDSQLLWRDTFVALALAAASTRRITLAPGVTNLVTRHVTVVASAARTVQELAPGRFMLALGAGRSAADMVGAAHTPTRELGESLRALRALLSGQPWSFGGGPQRLTGAAGACPVYLGAGGPRNVRLACAEADGIILAGTLSAADVTRTAAMVRALVARIGPAQSAVRCRPVAAGPRPRWLAAGPAPVETRRRDRLAERPRRHRRKPRC